MKFFIFFTILLISVESYALPYQVGSDSFELETGDTRLTDSSRTYWLRRRGGVQPPTGGVIRLPPIRFGLSTGSVCGYRDLTNLQLELPRYLTDLSYWKHIGKQAFAQVQQQIMGLTAAGPHIIICQISDDHCQFIRHMDFQIAHQMQFAVDTCDIADAALDRNDASFKAMGKCIEKLRKKYPMTMAKSICASKTDSSLPSKEEEKAAAQAGGPDSYSGDFVENVFGESIKKFQEMIQKTHKQIDGYTLVDDYNLTKTGKTYLLIKKIFRGVEFHSNFKMSVSGTLESPLNQDKMVIENNIQSEISSLEDKALQFIKQGQTPDKAARSLVLYIQKNRGRKGFHEIFNDSDMIYTGSESEDVVIQKVTEELAVDPIMIVRLAQDSLRLGELDPVYMYNKENIVADSSERKILKRLLNASDVFVTDCINLAEQYGDRTEKKCMYMGDILDRQLSIWIKKSELREREFRQKMEFLQMSNKRRKEMEVYKR